MKTPKRTKKRDTGTLADTPKKIFRLTKSRAVIKDAFNVRVAFNKLGKKLSYDELADRVLIDGKMVSADWVLRDLKVRADLLYGFQPTKEMFHDGFCEYARENTSHPIREYLDGLKWDREKRLDDMLMLYFGAEDTPFNRAVGKLFMIAAVRRMRIKIVEGDEGVKFDQLLVLEGRQGNEKSTALKILAGGNKYFTDSLPLKNDSKIFLELVTGKWIVEFGELAGIGKRDAESLKVMLSKETDRARLAYDRGTTEKPRTCIFVGTTNSAAYLKDITGNRRFWPVKTGQINLDDLRRDRNQLWAEAAYLEKKQESIVLDEKLWPAAEAEQNARLAADPWQDKLLGIRTMEKVSWTWGNKTDEDGQPVQDKNGKVIKIKVPFHDPLSVKIRAADLYMYLGIPLERQTQAHGVRIAGIMCSKEGGFDHRNQRFAGGASVNAYTLRRGKDAEYPTTVKLLHRQDNMGHDIEVSTVVDGAPEEPQTGMDLEPLMKDEDIPF